MSLAGTDAPMEHDPDGDEQRANERFQPIEHQHGARGPFAQEPARGRNGVEPESGKERRGCASAKASAIARKVRSQKSEVSRK